MKVNGKIILFTAILVVITTACKFFFGRELEWSGFSPVIAIALFSGFIIKQKDLSFLLPLIALFLSDAAIQVLYSAGMFENGYPGFYHNQWKNYLILMSATAIGWLLKGRSYSSLALGAATAPTVFFLISNFSVWMNPASEVTYARTFNGLLACYEAGLPFYRNSLAATFIFLPLILIAYNYLTKHKASLTLA
jgi:hypothetical protein